MIWVTAEDVVAIHSRIIQVSGGIDGLRDRAGLGKRFVETLDLKSQAIYHRSDLLCIPKDIIPTI